MDETAEPLCERMAADLDDGFTELVRVHASAVHAFLLRMTGNAAEADDLGQETFLRAYTALKEYSAQRRRALRPRAWLMTIAANVWRNHVRTCVRRPVATVPVEESCESWPAEEPGPQDHADTVADRALLVAALARLPERARVAVVLRHVVGMSYAEVAAVQGCPVGTVKAQVSRGLSVLREVLEPEVALLREVTM
ncbi:RNA polymerase sigma factor [Streptomyces gilvosporeus]|uniref:RNA polymerase subunit sigma-24 n=1 Tax=Streptomyces gilvosporeus TaxID=553510 RepID=A0A1V0TMM7_9ACTN|nr:RNA polymerase sigma factor [Streptomyces gilvosporeus]ARF54206.1 RNA polymerase subunit sigma-24 [Streptomyces gilvosporeus]